MNSVTVSGTVTELPKQIKLASGRIKAVFTVTESLETYEIEAWGKLAELALKYLIKGSRVSVSGKKSATVIEAISIALVPS